MQRLAQMSRSKTETKSCSKAGTRQMLSIFSVFFKWLNVDSNLLVIVEFRLVDNDRFL